MPAVHFGQLPLQMCLQSATPTRDGSVLCNHREQNSLSLNDIANQGLPVKKLMVRGSVHLQQNQARAPRTAQSQAATSHGNDRSVSIVFL